MKPFRPVFALALCATLGFTTPGFAGDEVILKFPLHPKAIDLSQFSDLDVVEMEGIHLGETLADAKAKLLSQGYEMTPLRREKFYRSNSMDGVDFRFEGLSYPAGAHFFKDENGMHQVVRVRLTSPYRGSVISKIEREIEWNAPAQGQQDRTPSKIAVRNLLMDAYGPTDSSCWIVSEGKIMPEGQQDNCRRHDVFISAMADGGSIQVKNPTTKVHRLTVYTLSQSLGDKGEVYNRSRPLMKEAMKAYLDEVRAKAANTGVLPKL